MANRVWQSTASTDASLAGNFTGNAAPVTGDTLTLTSVGAVAAAALTTNLPYYTNVAGLTIEARSNFTPDVGLEASGTNGATFLRLGATGSSVAYIGRDEGNAAGGSSMILLDGNNSSSGSLTAHVYKTGPRRGTYPALCIKGTSVALNCYGGETGFCVRPGDTGTITVMHLAKPADGGGEAPVLRIGAGSTISGTPRVEVGTLYNHASATIAKVVLDGPSAKFVNQADAAVTFTDLQINAGQAQLAGVVTVTAATVRKGGTFRLEDRQAKVIGTIYADEGATIDLDNGDPSSITGVGGGTNLVNIVVNGDMRQVKIKKPVGLSITVS